jgi:hypothetical protein
MRCRPISLFFILSAIFLTGCTNNTHTIHTLNVSTPGDLQVAIYIDSQYVGTTPLHMQVDQDTIEGAQLRIVVEGKEIKNYTLHKDLEIKNETGETAIALGAIGTGAAMIFTPFPLGIFLGAAIMGTSGAIAEYNDPSIKKRWDYELTMDSLSVQKSVSKKDSELKEAKITHTKDSSSYKKSNLHTIPRRWFWVKNEAKAAPKGRIVNGLRVFNSNAICYDKTNETVWTRTEYNSVSTPIPISEFNGKCNLADSTTQGKLKPTLISALVYGGLGLLLSQNAFVGLASAGGGALFGALLSYSGPIYIYKDDDCPQSSPEADEFRKWVEQFPCY